MEGLKMKKRLLSVLLSTAMAVSMLSGCGSSTTTETSEESSANVTTQAEAGTTKEKRKL